LATKNAKTKGGPTLVHKTPRRRKVGGNGKSSSKKSREKKT